MLIVKFRVHPDYQSILQAWLWHKCMDLVCDNLKAVATEGCFMPDPFRFIHYVFTPLVAHVCNLPEATMIAAVAKNASPLTMAMQEQFGNEILHLPRTGKHTSELLVDIAKTVDPWDLDKQPKLSICLESTCLTGVIGYMYARPSSLPAKFYIETIEGTK
jgi:hypothetical protein